MRLIVVGDLQLTDKIPIRRKDNFVEAEFNKLKIIAKLVNENRVDAVFLLGDVFDSSVVSLWFINRVMQEFKEFKKPIYSIVGNHDVQGRVEGVHECALGTLFTSGVVSRLSGNHFIDGIKIKAIDYTTNHSLDLYEEKVDLILTHNMITPKKFEFANYILASEIAEVVKDTIIITGHYHTAFEYSNQSTNSLVINPGVIVRTDISEIDIIPSVLLLNIEKGVFSHYYVAINALEGKEVFNVDEYVKEKEGEMNLKEFIDSIKGTQFQSQDIEAIIQRVGREIKSEEQVVSEALRRIKLAKASV